MNASREIWGKEEEIAERRVEGNRLDLLSSESEKLFEKVIGLLLLLHTHTYLRACLLREQKCNILPTSVEMCVCVSPALGHARKGGERRRGGRLARGGDFFIKLWLLFDSGGERGREEGEEVREMC